MARKCQPTTDAPFTDWCAEVIREGRNATAAWECLFKEFYRPALRFCLSRGLRIADADELVQNAFFSIWKRLITWHLIYTATRTENEVQVGYLYTTLNNSVAAFYEAHPLYHQTEEVSIDATDENSGPVARELSQRLAETEDPNDELSIERIEREAKEEFILQAIAHLPYVQRRVITLRLEGKKHREIMEIFKWNSPSNVTNHWNQGVKKLKELLMSLEEEHT
jgi:RNA polymerase sigma factor (sigma-70 family)